MVETAACCISDGSGIADREGRRGTPRLYHWARVVFC
jgi:hypothetical protein